MQNLSLHLQLYIDFIVFLLLSTWCILSSSQAAR